ncbi:hypothetical protein V6N13_011927 [Hibiscus sabdariffa]|uniref:Uncharacterized protein n=1 Tax=Hibiscus sabdariffa TaxID=183260 RepID=A0ABR2SDP3_9ROSI
MFAVFTPILAIIGRPILFSFHRVVEDFRFLSSEKKEQRAKGDFSWGHYSMHFQPSLLVRLLKKLMIIMLVVSVLVSGYQKEDAMLVGMDGDAKERQPWKHQHHQHHQRSRRSIDVFFSSKRKVPNASDPLHNR